MNWGGFAGGFAQGLDTSIRIGKTFRDLVRETNMNELRSKGMAEAEAERKRQANAMIKEGLPEEAATKTEQAPTETPKAETAEPQAVTPQAPASNDASLEAAPVQKPTEAAPAPEQAPAPKPAEAVVQPTPEAKAATPQAVAGQGMPEVKQKPSGKFSVAGRSFDTREEALAHAEKVAPSASDLFMKNTVPKIAQQYIEYGDPEKAKAWTDYAESVKGKRAMKDWAAAYTAPDFDTAVSRFGKYYTDHIDDGVDYVGHKMLTKQDGTQVAVVSLKDKTSGKTMEMELTKQSMLQLGGANNPQKLFEQEVAKQTAAEKARFEHQLKREDRRAQTQESLKVEQYKQDRLDQRENIKGKNDVAREGAKQNAKIDAQVESLRDAGYSDDEIKAMMPSLVGAGTHKKTTDPAERRALIASDLLKNDPSFARKPAAEKSKVIDDMMTTIYGEPKGSTGDKPAAKQGGAKVETKPMAYDPKLPVKYRKSDNKPFHYINGQYVPIDGGVPAQGPAQKPAAPAQEAPKQAAPTPAATAAKGMPEQQAKPVAPKPAANEPSYDKWIAAKKVREDILSRAKSMSPSAREQFLESRLPEIDAEIAFHSKYKTY